MLRNERVSFLIRFIKQNAGRAGILCCAFFVSFVNIKAQNKSFSDTNPFSPREESFSPVYNKIEKPNSLALAPISNAYELADYEQYLKEEGEKSTVLGALMPISNPSPDEFASSDLDVFIYKVEEGDTVGSIAIKYSITSNTILWANDLREDSIIRPGDEIFILPTTGVKHKIKDGDSVKSLAKKYKADEDKIIAFNNLPANGELKKGEEIIIPDGKQEDAPRYRDPLASSFASRTGTESTDNTESSGTFSKKLYAYPAHRFPYGWCTWYVASRRHIPWGGNAGTWLYHAKSYGAKTGKTPQKGAIIVTGESRWGHVAIVEKVKGDQVTIKEMNYKGWGIVSSRNISAKSSVIKGYIY